MSGRSPARRDFTFALDLLIAGIEAMVERG